MQETGRITPPGGEPVRDAGLLEIAREWTVINGKMVRRTRAEQREPQRPHLPRVASEPQSPTVRRRLALDQPRVAPRPSTGRPVPRPHSQIDPLAWGHDWSAPQLDLMHSSLPGSPRHSSSTVKGIPAGAGAGESASARNSTRSDAVRLAQLLERQLHEGEHDFRATASSWRGTFVEVVRQVYVQCAERGMLLDRVRKWYDLELDRLGALCRQTSERERKLREALRKGSEPSGTGVEPCVAVNSQVCCLTR